MLMYNALFVEVNSRGPKTPSPMERLTASGIQNLGAHAALFSLKVRLVEKVWRGNYQGQLAPRGFRVKVAGTHVGTILTKRIAGQKK